MKKVGIITFHRAKNCGAVLQGYALQKAVQSFGNDCEIIDYKCENIDKSYKPFQFNASDPVKSIIKSVIMFRKRSKRIKSFSSFYNNYLRISQESYTDSEIKDCKNKYDIFITGSDQVWGPGKKGVDPDSAYFLKFADDYQKFSYAASFGVSDISDEKIPVMKSLMDGFQTLSVREESAVKIVKKITGKDALCHIDPTFLLPSDEWKKIAVTRIKTPYILVFNVKPVKSLLDFAENLSGAKNIPVIYITDNPQKKHQGFTYVSAPTVEEFLGYFLNATYTVTNSFHGTAFSLIFHKNLFVEFETARGFNDRACNLLTKVGINREIKNGKSEETEILWDKAEEILNIERNNAYEYLKQITE